MLVDNSENCGETKNYLFREVVVIVVYIMR